MGDNSDRIFLLSSVTLTMIIASIQSVLGTAPMHRIVFQTRTLSLELGTLRCYGTCIPDPLDLTGKLLKDTDCDGNSLSLNCIHSEMVKIHFATAGQLLTADEEYCDRSVLKPDPCTTDVKAQLVESCDGTSQCRFEFSNKLLGSRCSNVEYMYIDVEFFCVTRPTTSLINAWTPTRITTNRSIITQKKDELTTVQSIKLFSSKEIHSVNNKKHKQSPADQEIKENMFWLMTAYSWMTDKEFIKANGTHLALAIILSVFIGMVLSLCFLLDHCRRERIKRARDALVEENNNYNTNLLVSQTIDRSEEDIELQNIINRENKIERNGILLFKKGDLIVTELDNNPRLGEKSPLTYIDRPPANFLQQLPAPPPEILPSPACDEPDAMLNQVIPPPREFISDKVSLTAKHTLPSLVVTSPTPSNSSGGTQKTLISKQLNTSNATCSNRRASDDHNLVDTEDNFQAPSSHSSNELFHPIQRKSIVAMNDTCKDSRFSMSGRISPTWSVSDLPTPPPPPILEMEETFMNRKSSKNDIITSENEDTFWSPPESFNMERYTHSEKAESFRSLNRLPRKGRLHVIANETGRAQSERDYRSSPEILQSKCMTLPTIRQGGGVFTVPRHTCGSGHNHACVCVPVRLNTGKFSCACSNNNECCMMACDVSSVVQKEPYSKQRPLTPTGEFESESLLSNNTPSHCNTNEINCGRICDSRENSASATSNESRFGMVEESGYHSHGTGTDSLCSSSRSTDQEDFHTTIISNNSQLNGRSNGRNKVVRTHKSKLPTTSGGQFRNLSSTGSSNRTHRRPVRYDNKTESRPSESSLEEERKNEIVKIAHIRSRARCTDDSDEEALNRIADRTKGDKKVSDTNSVGSTTRTDI